jgi:hypothetical protein
LRDVVFFAQGDGLAVGAGDWLATTVLVAPAVLAGELADVAPGVRPASSVVLPLGFGVEVSLLVGDGDAEPLALDDVVGLGLPVWIWPTGGEDDADAAGLLVLQSGDVDDPPDGPSWPTGL